MINDYKIPFARVAICGNELKYLQEVLVSGWLTTSSKTLEFERCFSDYVGAKYACAVNSCTAALHLAVEALGIKAGDKVLVPTMTFTASAEVLRYIGAHPVFIDVEYDTCLVSPSILRKALIDNPDVKALILVHFGGQAPVMTTPEGDGILDICRSNNIILIEDAAHAFPSRSNGRFVGTFGEATCFSFYANKTITTGEGGMLITNDEDIYERAKVMRLHGIDHDIWRRFTDNKSCWEYDVVAPGFKYNMPDVNAAIGLAQLEKAEDLRALRQHCAEFYFARLRCIQEIDLPFCRLPMEDHSWHLFPVKIRTEAGMSRNEFKQLMCDKGIGTSVHYKPLHRMTYYKEAYNLDPCDFPDSERIWNSVISLPIYPGLLDEELAYICDTIQHIFTSGLVINITAEPRGKAI
jgi:dTDP-4-amino-4,6-dideoxygalactose transaminase